MLVKNNSSYVIQVAIDKWGNTADTSYFTISPGGFEDWDRSDARGFIMSLKRGDSDTPPSYFIKSDSNITVNDDSVIDTGSIIYPLN